MILNIKASGSHGRTLLFMLKDLVCDRQVTIMKEVLRFFEILRKKSLGRLKYPENLVTIKVDYVCLVS